MSKSRGLIRIFTGNGKGKTTAALGSALRAAGENRRVVVVQFLKGTGYTGELEAAKLINPKILIRQFGFGCHISSAIKEGSAECLKCGICFRENRNPVNNFAPMALAYAQEILAKDMADLIILDEISHALKHDLIPLAKIINIVNSLPPYVELILTGRNMPSELMAIADEITVCHAYKHPMTAGLAARRGIEY